MSYYGRRTLACLLVAAAAAYSLAGCGSGGGHTGATLIVTSLADPAAPLSGPLTLRNAIEIAQPGDTITFEPALNGGTIDLAQVADEHSVLRGEVYAGGLFSGYEERDYGRSALYAHKDLTIDASALPDGITIRWSGGDADPARVLAVFGDLTLRNVTIRDGRAIAAPIAGGAQPFTLARGAGLAVWGILRMESCVVTGNQCVGDTGASRDRGTYGGGIYANGLEIRDSVVSGNSAVGYGAAGGGIYSVGGADMSTGRGFDTELTRSAITGNRVTAQHAYGGGIFTLSGGPNNLATMRITNCTIARNVVEDNPALPDAGQYYYRGGGIYMGGGSLVVQSCTIAENEVSGALATFSGKPNVGGGGCAATVGNAHTVEDVSVQHSIVAGNRLNGAPEDWFVGSLLSFTSQGYNLFGVLDFRYILAPVPDWMDLCRKHYPKVGDQDGLAIGQVLDVAAAERHPTAISAGVDAGQPAVVWYPPIGAAVDRVPGARYTIGYVRAGYAGFGVPTDAFLNEVLAHVRSQYGAVLGAGFGTDFGDMAGTTWYGPRVTWPSEANNAPWIAFWRNLDTKIDGRLGPAGLNDDFWGGFTPGTMAGVQLTVERSTRAFLAVGVDQRNKARSNGLGDIGAIER